MIGKHLRWLSVGLPAFNLASVILDGVLARQSVGGRGDADDFSTETPIKHVVVIFQENAPFDHSFGIYPHAASLPGETAFQANNVTAYISP